jgi:hypothetical protein
MTEQNMLKKIFLITIVLAIAIAWLGGVWSLNLNPFSLTIRKPEKDFLKMAVDKAKSLIYSEATKHNPPGDILPDQIDDKLKGEVKKIVD